VRVGWLQPREFPPKPRPANEVAIVLGDLANTTGDPAFDGMLRQIVAVELGKSPSLRALPDARMSETLRLMSDFPHVAVGKHSLGSRQSSLARWAPLCPIIVNALEEYKHLTGYHRHALLSSVSKPPV
jgi:hypothetical protein